MLRSISKNLLASNKTITGYRRSTSVADKESKIPTLNGEKYVEGLMSSGGLRRYFYYSRSLFKQYGDALHVTMYNPGVILFHPDLIQKVYENEGKYPQSLSVVTWPFRVFFKTKYGYDGNPIISLTGEEWKEARRIVQKDLFSPKEAAVFLPMITKVTEEAAELFPQWENRSDRDNFFPLLSFELLHTVLFGHGLGILKDFDNHPQKELALAGMNSLNLVSELTMYPPEHAPKDKLDEYIRQFGIVTDHFDKYIEEAIKSKKEYNEGEVPYLSKLVARGELDTQNYVVQLAGLLLAAFDTTANATHWFLYHLARTPNAQQKLYEEINSVVGNGTLKQEHLNKIPYMKAALKENFRISPILPTIPRIGMEEIDIKGEKMPAGTLYFLTTGSSYCREESVFENPLEFRPERWSRDKKGQNSPIHDNPYTVNPFSFGPRMCVGARVAESQIMSFTTSLLKRYSISLAPDSPHTEHIMHGTLTPIPAPKFVSRKRT